MCETNCVSHLVVAEGFVCKRKSFSNLFVTVVLIGGVIQAQEKPATVPDAQIEANVLKALAGAPQLADQSISTTTVYGTVTISGTVRDEASRDMAEQLVSNAPGVKKVVDELTIGTATPAANDMSPQSTCRLNHRSRTQTSRAQILIFSRTAQWLQCRRLRSHRIKEIRHIPAMPAMEMLVRRRRIPEPRKVANSQSIVDRTGHRLDLRPLPITSSLV